MNRHRKLGTGKEGTTFLVTDERGCKYAMKTFRKTKAISSLQRECSLQKRAARVGIAPRIHRCNLSEKTIVMEKMDSHLYDTLTEHDGKLTVKQQRELYGLFRKLDQVKVFHNDPNLSNYMIKNKRLYLIDYGFAREITPALCKKLGTDTPNRTLMLLGLILKLKELNVPASSYRYLLSRVSAENKSKYRLIE